jgi:hypothetical protein
MAALTENFDVPTQPTDRRWEIINGVRYWRGAVAYLNRELFFGGGLADFSIPEKPMDKCLACHLYVWGLDNLRKALLLPDTCQIIDLSEAPQWNWQRIALHLQSPEFRRAHEACTLPEVEWAYRSYDDPNAPREPAPGLLDSAPGKLGRLPDGYTIPKQVVWWDGWTTEAVYDGNYAAYRAERQRLWEEELVRAGVTKP